MPGHPRCILIHNDLSGLGPVSVQRHGLQKLSFATNQLSDGGVRVSSPIRETRNRAHRVRGRFGLITGKGLAGRVCRVLRRRLNEMALLEDEVTLRDAPRDPDADGGGEFSDAKLYSATSSRASWTNSSVNAASTVNVSFAIVMLFPLGKSETFHDLFSSRGHRRWRPECRLLVSVERAVVHRSVARDFEMPGEPGLLTMAAVLPQTSIGLPVRNV